MKILIGILLFLCGQVLSQFNTPVVKQSLQVSQHNIRSFWKLETSNHHLYASFIKNLGEACTVYIYDCESEQGLCIMTSSMQHPNALYFGIGLGVNNDLMGVSTGNTLSSAGPQALFYDCRNIFNCVLLNQTTLVPSLSTPFYSSFAWSGDYVAIASYDAGSIMGIFDTSYPGFLQVFLCSFEECNLTPISVLIGLEFSPAWGTSLLWNGDFLFVGDPAGMDPFTASVALIGNGKSASPTIVATLTSGQISDQFGYSMVFVKDLLIVGAPSGNDGTGCLYIYQCPRLLTCRLLQTFCDNYFANGKMGNTLTQDYEYVITSLPYVGGSGPIGALFALNCSYYDGCYPINLDILPQYYVFGLNVAVDGKDIFVYAFDENYALSRLLVLDSEHPSLISFSISHLSITHTKKIDPYFVEPTSTNTPTIPSAALKMHWYSHVTFLCVIGLFLFFTA